MAEAAVEVRRGGRVESVILADAAVVDSTGRITAWVGDPEHETYMRSAAKPFQAMPVVTTGAAERFHLGGEDLALITSSHQGESDRVKRVEAILARADLDPSALLLAKSDRGVAHGCSGSHTGMLLVARTLGASAAGYERSEHPAQAAVLAAVAEAAGLRSGQALTIGPDACGVPTFYLSLIRMAYAYAQLADPRGLDVVSAGALELVAEAMRQYPRWVSGAETFETRFQEASGRRLIIKTGGEGIACVGIPERGIGIALKMADGSSRGLAVALGALLRDLGALWPAEIDCLSDLLIPAVRDVTNQAVGELRPIIRMHLGRLPSASPRP